MLHMGSFSQRSNKLPTGRDEESVEELAERYGRFHLMLHGNVCIISRALPSYHGLVMVLMQSVP